MQALGCSWSRWYADDGHVAGSWEVIRKAFDLLCRELPRPGLTLNVQKCCILTLRAFPAHVAAASPVPVRSWQQGIKSLGVPIGDDRVVHECLNDKLGKLDGFFQRLDALDDTHSQLLLRHCLGACRVGYLMRALRFDHARSLAERAAALIVRSIQAIAKWSCSPAQLLLASCPTRAGGLGIRDPTLELPGAAIGSVLSYLIQEMDAPVASFLSHPQLLKAAGYLQERWNLTLPVLESWESLRSHSLSSRVPEEACKEKFWSGPVMEQLLLRWDESAPARLRVIRAACKDHVDVFAARPPAGDGLRLTSRQWRLFLQYRLAIPFHNKDVVPCRGCGSPVDTFGDHALMCPRLGMYSRHNHLRNTLAELLRSYGFSARLEASPTASQERPADVLVCGVLDIPDAVDVSFSRPASDHLHGGT